MNARLKYHEYMLLNDTNVVELNDNLDQLWVKESRVIPAATKTGTRNMSHWRKHDLDDLVGEARLAYDFMLAAECSDAAPLVEYEFQHEDVCHRLTKYSAHLVYHVTAPKLQLERVVVAKDADALINHSYGIGGLYYRLVTDLS
jgi:hypothetical protein